MQRKLPHIRLSKEENSFYKFLFERMSTQHPSKKDKRIISSNRVKEMFPKSNLSNPVLMEIWRKVSDNEKKYLVKQEFYVALKFIAMY